MTDKKKLDEAVTLTMNSNQGEIQMNTTVVANDLAELALLLKNSGIVADDFSGPANLSQDEEGMSTNVSAPNLRAIMNMLEPVFQIVGDTESDMMEPMDAEMDSDDVVDPVIAVEPDMEPNDFSSNSEYDNSGIDGNSSDGWNEEGNLDEADETTMKTFAIQIECSWSVELGSEEDRDDDSEEDADYQTNYEVLFKDFVAPTIDDAIEMVKEDIREARGGDNNMVHELIYNAGWEDMRHGSHNDKPGVKILSIECDGEMYYFPGRDLEEDAEYNYRTHDVHPREYPAASSKEIVQPKTHMVPARSSDNPLDEQDGPKSFFDYVKEAELNVSSSTVAKVNKSKCKIATKVTESTVDSLINELRQFNELSSATKASYAAKAHQSKIDHEKKASDLDDLVHDARSAEKMGMIRKGAGDRVDRVRKNHDRTAWKREKGLDRLATEDLSIEKMGNHEITFSDPADDEIDAMRNDSPSKLNKVVKDISADMHEDDEMRRMPPRPTDFNSVAKRARDQSREGYVQHVDRHDDGRHSISDWMSDNTVASFSNGRHHGGEDIDESNLNEISQDTKDKYRNKARGELENLAFATDFYRNDPEHQDSELASQYGKKLGNRNTGIKKSYAPEPVKRHKAVYDKTTGFYDIVDTNTGEIVERQVANSGGAAMSIAANWDFRTKDDALDEASFSDYERKTRQFGTPFYMNTDCGYASLEDIVKGHDYFDGHGGFIVLEIERNGRTGLNYLSGVDDQAPVGTKVTCVTQTHAGRKYRPGKVVASVTADELANDYDGVVKKLAAYGITPTKKLSVKTFD